MVKRIKAGNRKLQYVDSILVTDRLLVTYLSSVLPTKLQSCSQPLYITK